MSRYDEIYDEHVAEPSPKKKGTKYELLMARVAQQLGLGGAVHDIKLIGDSEVKHQIDVNVAGKRLIIECKDLEESGDKVGLEIVKSFATVVRDLNPDEAWIVTTLGFTRPARKLAKHERIKLVVLREFSEDDWEGRIRTITVSMTIKADINHRIQFVAGPTGGPELIEALAKFGASTQVYDGRSGVILTLDGQAPRDIALWLQEKRKDFDVLSKTPGEYRAEYGALGAMITLGSYGSHPISGIAVDYTVVATEEQIIIDAGAKIAALILQGFGEHDLVVWDTDLKAFTVDADGAIVAKTS